MSEVIHIEKKFDTKSLDLADGILIVIVSYNCFNLMRENINSIRKTVLNENYRIVVVDNASEDGVAQWLSEQDDIILVCNSENIGFGPACNQGVESVKGTEYESWDIFLLNNDTRLTDNSLYCLKQALYSREDVGAVGSVSNYAGNHQEIYKEFDTVTEYLEFGRKNNRPYECYENSPYEERVRLTGFAMLIRRCVWDKTGGFDTDFAPGYIEDDALSTEIIKAGYRLLVVHNSFIYHAGSQSFMNTVGVHKLYEDHIKLYIQKYGFDISEYAYPDEALICQLPYKRSDKFMLLQLGCGLGADIKAIREHFSKCRVVGIETRKSLYSIACNTEEIYASLADLCRNYQKESFDVLVLEPDVLKAMSQEERGLIAGLCRRCASLIMKNPKYNNFSYEDIKLIIWELDDNLWHGTLCNGEVELPELHKNLIELLIDKGVLCSISSRNEYKLVQNKLIDMGISDLFVFNDINHDEKSHQIAQKIELMGIQPENVLFIDNDLEELEKAQKVCPNLMIADANIIPYLYSYFLKRPTIDSINELFKRYRVIEKRANARRKAASLEQFLYDSDIHVTINKNCLEELNKIIELAEHSFRMNYTKNQINKDRLIRMITNDWMDSGYIRVRDRYGDDGIVGFYCYDIREKKMEHFLFSDLVLGMGVEQFIYNKLGCPSFTSKEPVSIQLNKSLPMWISEDKNKEISRDMVKEKRVRILLKGGNHLSLIEPYLTGGNTTTEFDYINEQGFWTTGQNHSMHIFESRELTEEQICDICREVPFVTRGDFETKIFRERYNVICLTLDQELIEGLYQNKETGAYISFGNRKYPLTNSENHKPYIIGEVKGNNFNFTKEILDEFSQNWKFIGCTPIELLFRNLEYIYKNVLGYPIIILLLGNKMNCGNEEYEYHTEEYRSLNTNIYKFAENHKRIRIIDMSEYLYSVEDVIGKYNDYERIDYFGIAGKVCDYINESVDYLTKR